MHSEAKMTFRSLEELEHFGSMVTNLIESEKGNKNES